MVASFYTKLLIFLKHYYLYVFAVFLLIVIASVKIFSLQENTNTVTSQNVLSSEVLSLVNTSLPSNTNNSAKEEPKDIHIDLSGAVVNPGIYIVPSNAMVGDVVAMGGGLSKNASALWVSRNINFSKTVSDTQKIYIPFDWETHGDCSCVIDTISLNIPNLPKSFTSADTSSNNTSEDSSVSNSDSSTESSTDIAEVSPGNTSPSGEVSIKLNVNTSTKEQLDELPGIGPSYAQKILDNRPYSNLTDFINKSGIPKSTIEKISSEISF